MRRATLSLFVLALSACSLDTKFPEGRFVCSQASDCPPDWVCRKADDSTSGLCYSSAEHAPMDASMAMDGSSANGRDSGHPGPDASAPRDDAGAPADAGGDATDAGAEVDASNPDAPSVSGILITKRFLNPSVQTQVSCFATAPDGAPLSYQWSASAGTFENPTAQSTKYTAGAVGAATLTCKAHTPAGSGQNTATARVYPSGWLTYLPFSLDSLDQSGHGNDATVVGGIFANDRAGRTGSAIELTAGDDSITLAHPESFALTAWSVVVTIKSDGHGGTLFTKAEGGFGTFTLFEYPSTDASLARRLQYTHQASGGPFSFFIGSYEMPEFQFVQLAITRSLDGQLQAYADGTLIHTENNLSAATQNTAPMAFGAGTLGGYTGTMDEIQVYDRVLEANEVSALVNMQ